MDKKIHKIKLDLDSKQINSHFQSFICEKNQNFTKISQEDQINYIQNDIKSLKLELKNKNIGFNYFLKGLIQENLNNNIDNDNDNKNQNIFNIYVQGFEQTLDPLCAYKLAEIYNQQTVAEKFGVKEDSVKSLFYYIIFGALQFLNYQVSGIDLYQIRKIIQFVNDKDGSELIDFLLQKYQSLLPTENQEFYVNLIKYAFQFRISGENNNQSSYDVLFNFLANQINTNNTEEPLLYIIRLLICQTHNHNKKIIEMTNIFQNLGFLLLQKVFQNIIVQLQLFLQSQADSQLFQSLRNIIFELFNVYKLAAFYGQIYKDDLQQIDNVSDQKNQISQNKGLSHQQKFEKCSEMIYYIFKKLYEKLDITDIQVQKTYIIRFFSEINKNGIGYDKNIQYAVQIQEKELEIKKNEESLYAFAYYQIAKISKNLISYDEQEIKQNYEKSFQLFTQRENNSDIFVQLISFYYLGRINMIYIQNPQKSQEYFIKLQDIYNQNLDKLNQTKTLQFQILYQKCLKKIEKFELTKAVSTRINKQSQKNDSEIHRQQQKQKSQIEIKLNNQNEINPQIPQSQRSSIKKKSMLQQIWSNKDCLVQNQQNLVFYDPKLINLTGFIAKNQIVTTNEGFLLQNLIDEQQQLSNSNNQLDNQFNFKPNNKINHKFNHFLGTENLNQNQSSLLQEQYKENQTKKIIVKSISFLREFAFDQIFYHLIKMNKIKDEPGLLQAIGLSINETYDKDQFKLMIIYPKIDYNLTGIIRQNILIDIQDKLNISLQLAEGIKSLHDNNIFHGNLKPNNVLISRDFQIQINDWEFTQKFNSKHFSYVTGKQNKQSSLNENIDQLQPNNKNNNMEQQHEQISDDNEEIADDFEPFYLKGYVSPEQINQKKPRTSVLSDIWSLGMLYYYIFFGANNTQFNNQNIYNVQNLYDEQDIDLSQIYSKGTNNYLDKMSELIEKMVKYQPEQRIQIQKVRDILIQLFVNIKAENKQIFVDQ